MPEFMLLPPPEGDPQRNRPFIVNTRYVAEIRWRAPRELSESWELEVVYTPPGHTEVFRYRFATEKQAKAFFGNFRKALMDEFGVKLTFMEGFWSLSKETEGT